MTKAQFNKLFNGVIGPAYAGAPYPDFDEYAINEAKFAKELRYKEYNIDYNEDSNLIHIEWVSQQQYGHTGLIDEILRCFREAIKFDGNIQLDIASRDDDEYISYHFSIENN